jgi:hypothetical protein
MSDGDPFRRISHGTPLSVTFRGVYRCPLLLSPPSPTTSPLDRVVTLFGIPIPLRDLGARCTRSFCIEGREDVHPEHDTLACELVTDALRRRWSMPYLDLATQQLSALTGSAVHNLIAYCRAVCRICCQVYARSLQGLDCHQKYCLDSHEKSVAVLFASPPDHFQTASVSCAPLAPIRWNSETPLPSLQAMSRLQQQVYRVHLLQQVAFLLGEPPQLCCKLYSNLLYAWDLFRWFDRELWFDDDQQSARAVWSRVCTVRYPGIVRVVAEVFPVVGLPELVAEYMVGVVCATDGPDGSRE